MVLRRRGGEIQVDEERDINPRHFPLQLRKYLKGALEKWGSPLPWSEGEPWRFDKVEMPRRTEQVGIYHGDLRTSVLPRNLGAVVITGDLVLREGSSVSCDIWCLGNVTVGKGCHLRTLTADGSVRLGDLCEVERWVDAAQDLHLGTGVRVAAASAGRMITVEGAVRGGALSAPTIRVRPEAAFVPALDQLRQDVAHWNNLRTERAAAPLDPERIKETQWIQSQSVSSQGDYRSGPGTLLLHDIVATGAVVIGDGSVVAGSIHASQNLTIGRGVLVTGNISCNGTQLVIEAGGAVGGSVHVDGDLVLKDGAIVGLLPEAGGVAAKGSVTVEGSAAVTLRVVAGTRLFT